LRAGKGHAARAKALRAKYDQVLAQAQTQLTQRQRLEDALLVKAKRDEVAAAWIMPAIAAAGRRPVQEQPNPFHLLLPESLKRPAQPKMRATTRRSWQMDVQAGTTRSG